MNAIIDKASIAHPRKECVPLAIGLNWGNDGAIYQEKLDGRFEILKAESGGRKAEFIGERMPGGDFIAWDIAAATFDGHNPEENVLAWGAMARWGLLNGMAALFGVPVVQSSTNGGALLQAVLARGGEGVVRKLPGATYFDAMQAAKRLQTWRCVVTALDYASGAAKISDAATGEDRGTCPLRNRATACRVGSIIKVEGENLSARGLILKPRPCKDTPTSWLVQF
jgi:hypothetical protein